MSSTEMTIDQLCLSPFNVRTNEADATATSGLERSILARGQIMPLVVHPMRGSKKKFGVHAGGRRYRSIKALIERGALPADFPVHVVVRDLSEAELIEDSTAENLIRRDLRDYEVFAAVSRAEQRGETVEKIAETLGQEVVWIKQCLRLGRLANPIFDAYSAEKITLDEARGYASTEDQALQLSTFEAMRARPQHEHTGNKVRALMKVGDAEAQRLLRFVGNAAYRDAGGRFELDLFADAAEIRGRVEDEGLLRKLADAKLAGVRDAVRARTGRPDLRFQAQPPQTDFGTRDFMLQISPRSGEGDALVLPDGEVVACIAPPDGGEPDVTYWWASRKAKHGTAKPASRAPAATETVPRRAPVPIGAALHTDRSPIGYTQRVNAAIKADAGLTEDAIGIFRSIRRTILRAALVRNASEHGEVARDYLIWSLLRAQVDRNGQQALGLRPLHFPEGDPPSANDHVTAIEANKVWNDALAELGRQSFITGKNLVDAFADYRASGDGLKNLAAAFVAGVALERSLGADGYDLPIHDAIADWCGLHDDAAVRKLWQPTSALLALLPKADQLAIAKPFVETATIGSWSHRKVGEVTASVLAAITGASAAVVRGAEYAASTWVHPLLCFKPLAKQSVTAAEERILSATEQVQADAATIADRREPAEVA